MKFERRQVAGWFLRVAAFVMLAALATIFQLDRHSRTRLTLMAYVPPDLGGFADANAARLLAVHAPDMAVARAESSLRHRPIDASTLSSFALAAVEGDDVDRAGQALTLAAQRGWRDTYTQVMVVGSAIGAENWEIAAQRIDALTRLRREQEAIFGSLSLMLQSEGGRLALADRLSESYPLVYALADFIGAYPDYGEEVSKVFVLSEAKGDTMDCSRFTRVTRTLLARNQGSSALTVWPERCMDGSGRTLAFSPSSDAEDPFAWTFPSIPGVSVRHGEGSVTVRNRDPLRRQFAYRYITLPQGQHRLRLIYDMRQGARPGMAAGNASVQISLRCDRTSRSAFNNLIAQEYEAEIAFEVPDECPTQFLAFSVSKGTVENLSIEID